MKLILGGPGCGKTTRLLEVMEEELARGVRPERLAFVSFTKKAVREATERACAKFGLAPRDLPWFRTVHSLAYRLLGIGRNEIMQHKHWAELGAALGYEFSRYAALDEGALPGGRERGDLLRFLDGLARARMVPGEQQLRESLEEVTPQELARYRTALLDYKRDTGALDFTDLLERYIADGAPLDVDVAIVDEAQDLSRLQWQMLRRAFANKPRVYIGGDDDQAIFRWSGADVDTFLSLKGEREILGTTHRLPRHIYGFSQLLVSRLSRRFEKRAAPRSEAGEVHRIGGIEQAPLAKGGTWMVLARNGFFLRDVKEWLYGEGLPFALAEGSSVDPDHLRGIAAWERLRKGEAVPVEAIRAAYALMVVDRGHKTLPGYEEGRALTLEHLRREGGCRTEAPWHEALERIPLRERTYYRAILRRGESLGKPPRIYLGTIHSVKGGEAENVVVLPSMTQRTWEGFERSPDDEHRTFYVAATRAKQRLFLAAPTNSRAYAL